MARGSLDITYLTSLQRVLDEFFEYTEPLIEEFHRAVAAFKKEIPQLAAGLTEIIEAERRGSRRFVAARDDFLTLCRSSLNPATSLEEVEDMLKQHLLTARIFRPYLIVARLLFTSFTSKSSGSKLPPIHSSMLSCSS